MITQEYLKELLHYDPETGFFTWKVSRRQMRPGDRAGYVMNAGYIHIGIDKRYYLAHRLAWLYIHGQFPKDQLDHINKNRTDNRIENLREADNFKNQANSSVRKDNRLGKKGIKKTKYNTYEARLAFRGKYLHLGTFSDIEEAVKVHAAKHRELYGDFSGGRCPD